MCRLEGGGQRSVLIQSLWEDEGIIEQMGRQGNEDEF